MPCMGSRVYYQHASLHLSNLIYNHINLSNNAWHQNHLTWFFLQLYLRPYIQNKLFIILLRSGSENDPLYKRNNAQEKYNTKGVVWVPSLPLNMSTLFNVDILRKAKQGRLPSTPIRYPLCNNVINRNKRRCTLQARER